MSRLLKSLVVGTAVILGLIFGLLATLAALNRRDEVAGFNQEIQYDDFAFSVQGVRKTHAVGDSTAKGVYYIVTLKVANHAKRVNYEFKRESPILVAEDGKQYRVSSDAQQSLDASGQEQDRCETPIPAGSSCVKEVVFDVPPEVNDPRLRISTGGFTGDILDTIFYGKKVIKLESEDQESRAR